jgi:hypothetical protein
MLIGIRANVSEELAATFCRAAEEECAWIAALGCVGGLGRVTVLEVIWEIVSFKFELLFSFYMS